MTPRSTSRRKKTRYLSLRRRLAAAANATPMVVTLPSPTSIPDHTRQLDLFPLHPGTTTAQADDDPHDEQLSRFFPSDDAVTLHSLLGPHSPSSPATASDSHLSPSSSSANYSACSSSYGRGAAAGLVRAALRGRERWWAEEEEEGEAASGGATGLLSGATRRLCLKLDYDGILSAWSGDRPLFVDGDGLQVVPDFHHTASPLHYTTVFVDVGVCGGGGLWRVPDGGGAAAEEGEEGGGGRRKKEEEGEEEVEEKAEGGKEDREARVMRYKEKRRHRLFAKRIRYEVRKLNAEKRPRVKGRFVKRDDDV